MLPQRSYCIQLSPCCTICCNCLLWLLCYTSATPLSAAALTGCPQTKSAATLPLRSCCISDQFWCWWSCALTRTCQSATEEVSYTIHIAHLLTCIYQVSVTLEDFNSTPSFVDLWFSHLALDSSKLFVIFVKTFFNFRLNLPSRSFQVSSKFVNGIFDFLI